MITKKYLRLFAFVTALSLAGVGKAFSQETSWDLTAGQTLDVGTVTVSNDLTNIYVTYTLDDPDYPNATFGTLQMWVGNSLLNVPANSQGTPVPGQFCNALGGECYDANGLKTYTFTIPFSALNIADISTVCGESLFVVTHAEVDLDGDPNTAGHETAFGGDQAGSGSRWWFYGSYSIDCNSGEPPIAQCETAFAKGGYVWTTDKKSNPDKLPSLNLTKNRWGWAINLKTPGTYSYDLHAGAGLNRISNISKVGTVTINWDGAAATVTYNMLSGKTLKEVHLYAGDEAPATIAPGQYGDYLEGFNPGVSTYTFNAVPLYDLAGDGVWLIAHGVACY